MIVDAQNEYDHGLLAISNVKSSRAVIGDVLKKYRDANGDVVSQNYLIFPTRNQKRPLDVLYTKLQTAEMWNNKPQVHVRHSTPDGAPLFTPKTELAEEFEELTTGAGAAEKVVLKQHPSSFTGTDLHEHLDKLGKKKIVLAGMSSCS